MTIPQMKSDTSCEQDRPSSGQKSSNGNEGNVARAIVRGDVDVIEPDLRKCRLGVPEMAVTQV